MRGMKEKHVGFEYESVGYIEKMIDSLEKARDQCRKARNREWLFRTETKIEWYKYKLNESRNSARPRKTIYGRMNAEKLTILRKNIQLPTNELMVMIGCSREVVNKYKRSLR